MRIDQLAWAPENAAHIAEHRVNVYEVEELFFEQSPRVRRGPGENLYHVYGRTGAGRYLFVVMIYLGGGIARDGSQER